MRRQLVNGLAILLLAAASATAQERSSRYGLQIFRGGEADVEIAGDDTFSVAVQETEFRARLHRHRSGPWMWGLGARAAWTRIDFEGPRELDRDLYDLGVSLSGGRRFGPSLTAMVLVSPRVASDLKGFDLNSFDGDFMGLLMHTITPTLRAAYGLMYNEEFGAALLLPVAGVEWEFVPGWTLDLIMPSVGVTYEPNEDSDIGVYAGVRGGEWRVYGADGTRDYDFSASRIMLGLGGRIRIAQNTWVRADAGTSLHNELEFFEGDTRNTVEPRPALFGNIAIEIR